MATYLNASLSPQACSMSSFMLTDYLLCLLKLELYLLLLQYETAACPLTLPRPAWPAFALQLSIDRFNSIMRDALRKQVAQVRWDYWLLPCKQWKGHQPTSVLLTDKVKYKLNNNAS